MRKSGSLEEHDAQVAREMVARHELTPPAGKMIVELAAFGHDVRAYYSASGRPFVWAFGKRYTAAEWNAHVERGSQQLLAWLALPYGTMPADVSAIPTGQLMRLVGDQLQRLTEAMMGRPGSHQDQHDEDEDD